MQFLEQLLARRLVDPFGNVQRHTPMANRHADTVFVTDPFGLRKILKLFRLPASTSELLTWAEARVGRN